MTSRRWAGPAGVGGAAGERPAREGLPGPAAPRSGRGRKRSRRPCGAGALTHGAQEQERERKGQTWRLRSAPAEEGEAGGGLSRSLGSLLPPLAARLLTSTSRPPPSCRLSSPALRGVRAGSSPGPAPRALTPGRRAAFHGSPGAAGALGPVLLAGPW